MSMSIKPDDCARERSEWTCHNVVTRYHGVRTPGIRSVSVSVLTLIMIYHAHLVLACRSPYAGASRREE